MRIYNGFRVAGGDIFDFISTWRTVVGSVRDELDAALIIERAIEKIGEADAEARPRPDSPLVDAAWSYAYQQASLKEGDYSHDPNRCELLLGKDAVTGIVVGIFFAEEDEIVKALLSIKGVSRYEYWSGEDRPDGVSRAEWKMRKGVWERVASRRTLDETMVSARLRYNSSVSTDKAVLIVDSFPELSARACASSGEPRARVLANKMRDEASSGLPSPALSIVSARFLNDTFSMLRLTEPSKEELSAMASLMPVLVPSDLVEQDKEVVPLGSELLGLASAYKERVALALRELVEQEMDTLST